MFYFKSHTEDKHLFNVDICLNYKLNIINCFYTYTTGAGCKARSCSFKYVTFSRVYLADKYLGLNKCIYSTFSNVLKISVSCTHISDFH